MSIDCSEPLVQGNRERDASGICGGRSGGLGLAVAVLCVITLQDFNVHGANTTHGTESEVFRGVKREENPQYIELLRRISTISVLRVAK